MKLRIIAHAGCTDGYSSAFVVKRYWQFLLPKRVTEQEVLATEIVPLYPNDLLAEDFQITSGDIVVDLPKPKGDVLFWCDHHVTNKPKGKLLPFHFWKITPSCTGFLIDLAVQNGLKQTSELLDFKKALDVMDAAEYTKQEISDCYYELKDFTTLSPVQKMHAISAMFNTRDKNLNGEVFKTLLAIPLDDTPLSSKALWQLNPVMYYRAQLQSYQEWRKHVDTYLYYDEDTLCVVQDDRKVNFSKGIADRFYAYFKFPQATYNLTIKPLDEDSVRIGLGSNIFHKERRTVDLGRLCVEVGKKFGKGSGGGHRTVGGATIQLENTDNAMEYILRTLKGGK